MGFRLVAKGHPMFLGKRSGQPVTRRHSHGVACIVSVGTFSPQGKRKRLMAVSTAAADLLVPAGCTFRQTCVDNGTNVFLVDSESKSGGCNNEIEVAVGPASY